MSFDALAWAARCNPGTPAKKLVLLALAECASRDAAEAYPSIATIEEFSSLNRKTIIAALDALEAAGFITDTGTKKGKTGQVKVYRLSLETVPKTERFQKRNSSTFSGKQYQKRDTELVREPVNKKTARVMPEGWQPLPFASASKSGEIVATWTPDELRSQVEHFAAHHRARASKFVEWQDAWRTWVLNSRKWGNRPLPRPPANDPSDFLAHMSRKAGP